jgi:hypothetical protein
MNQYTRHSFYGIALAGLVTATILVARQLGSSEPLELLGPCALALLSAGAGGIGLFTANVPDGACEGTLGGHSGAEGNIDLDGLDS